ncbi:hypothetical protein AKJ16_DCAP08992 [Drosera capensis]
MPASQRCQADTKKMETRTTHAAIGSPSKLGEPHSTISSRLSEGMMVLGSQNAIEHCDPMISTSQPARYSKEKWRGY